MTAEERFQHLLALSLGRTVEELHATMGAGEYRRWQMYYMAEPWGAMRDNWHAGMIASAIYNARPGKKRRLAKVKDFLLRPKEEERQETMRSTLGWLMALATKRRKRKK